MTGTVKAVTWHILRGECDVRLGPGGFDALLSDVGGPDPARTHPMDLVPAHPFRDALARVDRDGSVSADAAHAVVRVWARLEPEAADALRADPARLPDVLASEVHPFVTGAPDGCRVTARDARDARFTFQDGLSPEFRRGLVDGLATLAGAVADVTLEGADALRVRWTMAGPAPAASRFALALAAVRAPLLGVAAVPVLVGAAAAAGVGAFDPGLLALTLLGVVLIHAGMNALNDWFDHASGADAANPTPTRFSGGSRVIQRGLLSPRALATAGTLLVIAGSGVGVALALARGLPVLAFGAIGVLVGVLYSAPPVRLAHRGLGEMAFAVIFGPLVVTGSAFVQAGTIPPAAAWASLPVAALVMAVLYVNEFPDVRGDALAGKRTLVVRLGFERAVKGFGVLVAGAFALVLLGAALDLLPARALLALLPLPLAWRAWRVLRTHHKEPYGLLPAQSATLALHALTGLALAAALFPWEAIA